ncbi:uncharacterized protein LOC127806823 isoform X1 [Diospyros lotus]|uniref:uncharacterized protein LOC127806823 isoform X1 n=1 Tax=Diospyros lotus TaxID=55363 RepID=UPI00224CBF7E|nr:uncharacterized protein LOC127806823 isoform X1 [Diospyros lotus]
MNLLKIQKPSSFSIGRSTPPHRPSLSPPHLHLPTLLAEPQPWLLSASPTLPSIFRPRVSSDVEAARVWGDREDDEEERRCEEDLAPSSAVYQNTLRLVECSMFAAVSGLAYFLSNSLAIENYFGCFFALPIVISSMRWGIAAGRKTMVATAMLLLVLSGPVKALTYLLMHGLVGFTMGMLWRSRANWGLSVFLCACVRALGAVGYVLISSFLIRENILALITVNIHASLTYIITGVGINTIPSMNLIYTIFGTLVMLNCGFFVFLLHILYAVFFTRLGMKASLTLPRWLEKAI